MQGGIDMAEEKEEGLTLDKKTMDVLITNIIPTSKYFELRFDYLQQRMDTKFDNMQQQTDARFDHMQQQMDTKFDSVNARFDHMQQQMDTKFDSVNARFDHMQQQTDARFDSVDARFNSVDTKFDSVDARFNSMDTKFDYLQQQVNDIKSGVKSLDVKLDKLLERMDVKIDAGLRENRVLTIRLFTFALGFAAISMVGLLGKMLQIF